MHDTALREVIGPDFDTVFAGIPAPADPVQRHVAQLSAARARMVLAKRDAGTPIKTDDLVDMIDDLAGIVEELTA